MAKTKVNPGFRSGKLVSLERIGPNSYGWPQFLCRCDCGNDHIVAACRLSARKNPTRSCGCLHTEHQRKVNFARRLAPGEAACNASYLAIRNQCAIKRGLVWEITLQDWKVLSKENCHYCGDAPGNFHKGGYGRYGGYAYSGLDRVDNSMGYTLANVVPCCKKCNHAKSHYPVEEFLAWAHRLNRHQFNKGINA